MSMNKLFALLLTLALVVTSFASCQQQPPSVTTPAENSTEATSDLSTTVPEVPDVPVVSNGILLSSVLFSTDGSTLHSFAATELAWYLSQKGITVVGEDAEDEVKAAAYPITLVTDATIAEGGYKIDAAETGLTLAGGDARGLAWGLYNLLEKVVGVHFYASDTIVIDKDPVVIEWGVLDEFAPTFTVLRNPWQPIEALAEKNGGNAVYHENAFKTLTLDTLVGDSANSQPCLTSTENLTKAITFAKEFLTKYPSLKVLTFAPAPGIEKPCTCNACTALEATENSSTGAYILFINAIIEAIAADYPTLSFEVMMGGCFLSVPTSARLPEGVSVCISTADCHATHPLTDENCPSSVDFVNALTGWCDIASVRLEYVLSSTEYLATFANIYTLRENMRLFAEVGIDSFYCRGNFSCPSGEFGELRAYLVGKLLQDPLMSEEEYIAHMSDFLSAYYGGGWFYVLGYINKVTELANNEVFEKDTCGQSATDTPLTAITREEYRAYIYQFENYWNAAAALAGDRADAVQSSRVQCQYMQLCVNPNVTDAQALIQTVSSIGLCWRQGMRSVNAGAELIASPTRWTYAP